MRMKTLSRFRDEFINKAVLSLTEAMSETVLTFSLVSSSVCSFRAIYNCSSESDSRINCVCCDADITFFDITLINK